MSLRFPILLFLLSLILGCAGEPNRIDVKGDSMSTIKDSSKLINSDQGDVVESTDESDMLKILDEYGTYIRKYSKHYGFDWMLVLAVIKTESGFMMQAESPKGALGLMKIMPTTGKAIAVELNLEEVVSPRNNIAAGIYLLWKIADNYDSADEDNKIKITLAAYNCGIGRVSDARDIIRSRGGNPNDWGQVLESLKLLSKDNSDLHKSVWDSGKPPSGYFNDWQQPNGYVNTVLRHYNNFRYKFAHNI